MTVYGYGSADPKLLEKYDHLPPEQAIIRAWTEGEPSPRWHALAVRDVHNAMPLLARAIDRLISAQITDDIEADQDEVATLEGARKQARNGRRKPAKQVFDNVLVTDSSGATIGNATVVHGSDNVFEVYAEIHDEEVIKQIGTKQFLGSVHNPAPFPTLSSMSTPSPKTIKKVSEGQSEPTDPPYEPQL